MIRAGEPERLSAAILIRPQIVLRATQIGSWSGQVSKIPGYTRFGVQDAYTWQVGARLLNLILLCSLLTLRPTPDIWLILEALDDRAECHNRPASASRLKKG